jgi:hypothetical protein
MWTLFVLAALSTTSPAVEAHTLSGEAVSGTVTQLSAEQITLETSQGPVVLEVQRLTDVTPTVTAPETKPTPAVWLQLADGSLLLASEYTVAEGRARVVTLAGQTVDIPTGDITTVRLQPLTEALTAQWSRILEDAPESDLLVVSKDGSLDYHRGVLREVNPATVQFQLDSDLLPVKRTKVFGLVYYHPRGRDLPAPLCRLIESDGSNWAVKTLRLDGENLTWTTPLGLEVTRPLATLTRLDFSQGKIVYLSDLEPESVHWTPYLGDNPAIPFRTEFNSPRRDTGLEGAPLELHGKTYAKGLALHSRTEMVFRLPGPFRRLQAQVGIDDTVRPRGNVHLVVRGDERVLFEATVTGTEPPQPLDLDLTGVRKLAILVDFGEDMDVADHLDLGEARIVK